MCKGYMRLSRERVEDFEWSCNPTVFYVFFKLLFKANYKDKKWQGVDVLRGQILTGRKALSEELNLSEQTIRTCLDKLTKTGYINQQTTNKYSIITICEYDSWILCQPTTNQQPNQQVTNNPTNNQPTTNHNINKNIEELKKEIKKEIEEELTIVSEKKKKANPVRKSLGGKAQDLFVEFYKENGFSDTDYYWTPKDGSNMKHLLSKIRTARESKNMPCDDDSMLNGLKALLSSITDKWILAHFDVSTINSKYNEIVACARNGGSNGNMEVGRIMQYDKSKFEGVTSDNFFKG